MLDIRNVLGKIINRLNDKDIALFNLGLNSRFANSFKDRALNFYMIGSMGLISSVGLGLALNSKRKVFIFDGDGSLLMDMGTMTMIGSLKMNNFFHIVLDNESYCSTGKQPTYTTNIDLTEVAKACGYKKVIKITKVKEFENFVKKINSLESPLFCLIKTETYDVENLSRVSLSPSEITRRLKKNLKIKGKDGKICGIL